MLVALAGEAELAEHGVGLLRARRGRGGRAPPRCAVLPSREKIASATLSKAVRSSNRLTSWKLRAMPALTRWVTEHARDVLALEDDLARLRAPDSALMTLTSEVLPAPFGPTSEMNSPSSMERLTLSTARVSPK